MKKKALYLTIILLCPVLLCGQMKEPVQNIYENIKVSNIELKEVTSYAYGYLADIENTGEEYVSLNYNSLDFTFDGFTYEGYNMLPIHPLTTEELLAPGQTIRCSFSTPKELPAEFTVKTCSYNNATILDTFEIVNPVVKQDLYDAHRYLLSYDTIRYPGRGYFRFIVDVTYNNEPHSLCIYGYNDMEEISFYSEAILDEAQFVVKDVKCLQYGDYTAYEPKEVVMQRLLWMSVFFVGALILVSVPPIVIYSVKKKKKTQA